MAELVAVRRALLSVSDKTDLVPFARTLHRMGVELISTGGTAKALAEADLPVTAIDEITGFPEMLDGRVKTLHPAVHGGLLARRDLPEHTAAIEAHGIRPIDLVCINLYPFEDTVANPDVGHADAIEQIDIGGPAMIRSAAKNHAHVAVVTSPAQYEEVARELGEHDGHTTHLLRSRLASAAFGRTSEYDAAIASFMGRRTGEAFPDVFRLGYVKAADLRYGENPHQHAALYRDPSSTGPTIPAAEQLHGKPMSYNNIADAAAALEIVKTLRRVDNRAGAAVVKHTNPCGAAVGDDIASAVRLALAGDPLAAYGGILAVNTTIDAAAATEICGENAFLEVVVAPHFDDDARTTLESRWKNVRLLAVGDRKPSTGRKVEHRSVPGGMLVQDRDMRLTPSQDWTHAAGPAPTPETLGIATIAIAVCKHLSSNAVCLVGPDNGGIRLLGAGAGQMDRVASCRGAIAKAGPRAAGALAASDAFFPFADGPKLLIEAGATTLIHPGGSRRDDETFDLCNEHGVTCLLTGTRHFRH